MENNQKGFVIPMVIVALLVIGGGIYLYINKNNTTSDSDFNWITEDTYYNDGKRQRALILEPKEIAIIFKRYYEEGYVKNVIHDISSNIEIIDANQETVWIKLPDNVSPKETANELANNLDAFISPVFYLKKALTARLIIGFREETNNSILSKFESDYNLKRIKGFNSSPKSYLFEASSAVDSLIISNQIMESGTVEHAYPNFLSNISLE